ncbi:MAG: MBL fold metallo-hydrolase [Sphaerochaetaceae bacterium]|nr:MBL fold metallo-hydrolase [Sphaerochaetaceae bacterium]MDC7236254.1 MBL fold metallo-hydrolase [Sphaerochaetaceae bacterium]MDC7244192.1 MBL fold metallo-hydrolase [Sphaerochaetaceae bacterium]MDC7250302.1 MBL fold metallo-hydrolase [Sphaerochaetaceae bacterium]
MDKCTILLENSRSELLSTEVEHGLSLLIEINEDKMLFDLGSTGLFYSNANLMNINLSSVKTVILSHSHYDHCSGLLSFLNKQTIQKLYVGSGFFKPKYALNNSTITYLGCGFDRQYIEKKNIEINEIKNINKINEDLYLVTNFKQHYNHEQIPTRFVHGTLDNLTKDNFVDEIVLVKKRKSGLTLIVGCAHRGILSIIKSVNSYFEKNIDTVIGGIHLKDVSDERLTLTKDELIKLGIKKTFLCHCSGEKITKLLKEDNIIEANNVATGDIILL